MKLPCSQCRKNYYFSDFYEMLYHTHEQICFFCSRECKDRWLYFTAMKDWLEESSEVFDPATFIGEKSGMKMKA